jgi:hypothetical protein
VTPSGTVLDPVGSLVASGGEDAKVAFGGGTFLVTWTAWSPDGDSDVYGARVDTSGVVLDPGGVPIAASVGSQRETTVGFGDGTFLVAWTDFRGPETWSVHGVRVHPAGGVGARITIATGPGGHANPAVSYGAGAFLVVWEDSRLGAGTEVFGARVSPAGSVLDPSGVAIMVAPGEQLAPAVAFGGTAFLVVWEDGQLGGAQVRGARVNPMLDPSPIVLDSDGGRQPSIAFDGTNYLVAWSGPGFQVSAVRVSPQGYRIGDPAALPLPLPYDRDQVHGPSVASNGSGFLVAWVQAPHSSGAVLRAARVSSGGVVLEASDLAMGTFPSQPSVASDGSNYLVTWSDGSAVRGGRVDADGTLLDPGGINISADFGYSGAVSWNGQRYLVVWVALGGSGDTVMAARVTSDGTVQDPDGIVVAGGPGRRQSPVVAANGPFLVAWRERDGDPDRHNGVLGSRVGDDGVVRDVPGFRIATLDYEWPVLNLSAGPGLTWGMTYSRYVPEAPFAANRVFLRTIAPK